jgi:hypothetical protein
MRLHRIQQDRQWKMIEIHTITVLSQFTCVVENSRDQKSRKDEKQVHPGPSKPRRAVHCLQQEAARMLTDTTGIVEEEHRQNRQTAQTVQGWHSIAKLNEPGECVTVEGSGVFSESANFGSSVSRSLVNSILTQTNQLILG